MNEISEQYYKFIKIMQKILNLIGVQKFKIEKINQGVICLKDENGRNIEISTPHNVIVYCSEGSKNRILFEYDGIEITQINKDEHVPKNKDISIALAYNGKKIDFFSFVINSLANDCGSHTELKKDFNTEKFTSDLKNFITDPACSKNLYNYIKREDLVQPLVNTAGEIKEFLEQIRGYDFTFLGTNENGETVCKIAFNPEAKAEDNCVVFLGVRKEDKTISLNIVAKNIIISKDDIPKQKNNRYNIDYFGSIIECLHNDVQADKIKIGQLFSVNDFYLNLLPYSQRFDCLQSLPLQEAIIIKPPAVSLEEKKSSIISTTKTSSRSRSKKQSRKTIQYSNTLTSTSNYTESGIVYPAINSTPSNNNSLLPYNSNNNSQSVANLNLAIAVFIPIGIIIVALIWLCYRYTRKNNNQVGTELEGVALVQMSNKKDRTQQPERT